MRDVPFWATLTITNVWFSAGDGFGAVLGAAWLIFALFILVMNMRRDAAGDRK